MRVYILGLYDGFVCMQNMAVSSTQKYICGYAGGKNSSELILKFAESIQNC